MGAVRKEPMANPRAFAVTACGVLAAAAAILALAPQAHTQATPNKGYPERTVRIIVPTAAGGSIDTTARVVAAALAQRWGKPVVIENRPGAAMIIGTEAAAKSPPDGYTILIAHDGTMAMNPVVYPNLAYHSQRDFEPLALLTSIPEVVLVNEALPVKSIGELIAFAKANPGKLNHASGGTATLLALELIKAMAELATANAGMQSGKLRTLAVTTRKRVPRLPDVPTIDESGVPGYDVATWIGAFAPAGTPKAILDTIEAAIKQALAAPNVKANLEALSIEIRSGASADLRAVLAGDMDKWGRLVKEKNIRIAQ